MIKGAPRIGELRHRVMIKSPVPDQYDAHGQPLHDPIEIGPVFAKIEHLRGNDLIAANMIVASATHKVTVRYDSRIVNKSKLEFNDRTLHVGEVNNIEERNVWMVLTCGETE